MIRLDNVPYGREAIETLYGDPRAKDFTTDKLESVELPFSLRADWLPSKHIYKLRMHKLVAASLKDALREVLDNVGEEKLREMNWDLLGDAYVFRNKAGAKELSTHSWGIAIDISPKLGPFGKPCPDYPKIIVKAFEDRGWIWGGRWRSPDGMHFQAGRGY